MEIAIGLLLVLLVVAVAAPVMAGKGGRRAAEAAETGAPGAAEKRPLRYRVPDGQDPAVLMATLEQAGYSTALDEEAGAKNLLIGGPNGREPDRAGVRELIQEADLTSMEGRSIGNGRVVFEDEK
jgi:hypothetical protein